MLYFNDSERYDGDYWAVIRITSQLAQKGNTLKGDFRDEYCSVHRVLFHKTIAMSNPRENEKPFGRLPYDMARVKKPEESFELKHLLVFFKTEEEAKMFKWLEFKKLASINNIMRSLIDSWDIEWNNDEYWWEYIMCNPDKYLDIMEEAIR